MFSCFVRRNWKPSEFYAMSSGEKIIINAFLEREVELEKEANKK